jgi:hypothetical protein
MENIIVTQACIASIAAMDGDGRVDLSVGIDHATGLYRIVALTEDYNEYPLEETFRTEKEALDFIGDEYKNPLCDLKYS